MPCNDGYLPDRRSGDDSTVVKDLRKKNDDLTAMLCSLLRTLDDAVSLPPDIVRWYEEHKAWDRSQGRP